MKKMTAVLLSMVLAGASSAVMAGGNAAAGKAKSVTCQGCHGPKGISTSPIWPNLAGQKEAYLAKQLHAFKSGARKDPTMSAMAKPLSDADIANLAAYYSSLK